MNSTEGKVQNKDRAEEEKQLHEASQPEQCHPPRVPCKTHQQANESLEEHLRNACLAKEGLPKVKAVNHQMLKVMKSPVEVFLK